MLQLDMSAKVRSTRGKGAARVLRSNGMTPAVLYGAGVDPVSLELETKAFSRSLLDINRRNAVIKLEVQDGKKKDTRHVMIKEIQVHPIRDELVHADFCEISLEAPMILDVPIELTGKAKGVELGGILQFTMHKVPMRGMILDFPDTLCADISGLAIEDSLTCNDLDIPGNMELLADGDRQVVFVADPSKVKVAADFEEEEEGAAAEGEGESEGAAAEGSEESAGDTEGEAAAE